MSKREGLLDKLQRKPIPNNFTAHELDSLMSKCGCKKYSGGRGSSIAYFHEESERILTFDQPHPGNELHKEHILKTIKFLKAIGEIVE